MSLFLRVFTLIFILLGLGCKPSSESDALPHKQHFNWRLVTSWPKNFPALGTAPEKLARIIEEMSNGRLTITVYAAGEIVPALEVFDAVSRGTVEMGHSAAYYWKGKMPAAQFFASVPFGFTAQEINSWLYYGGGLSLWQELYHPYHVIPYPGGNTGVQMSGWFNKKITSPNDLQGLKMRIPGLGAEVLENLGGVPVNLPGGEIFTSLQSGVIDASEWVGPYNDVAFGLQKAAKYYYYPGWHEPGSVLEFDINQSAYDSLPEDLQKILVVAIQAINHDMLNEFTARNSQAYASLLATSKTQVLPLPDSVLLKLKTESEQVKQLLAKQSPEADKIYNSMQQFLTNVQAYQLVSEESYLAARRQERLDFANLSR